MTAPTPASLAPHHPAKPIAYAENNLGVHSVYSDAIQARDKLDEALTLIAQYKDRRHALEQELQDREIEITSDEVGAHPQMSQAALDRHLKLEIPKNPEVRRIKSDLVSTVSSIEGLEYDIRIAETDIRIAVGRMTELGGYLYYLAEIKKADQTRKTRHT